MPYTYKKENNKYVVYNKSTGKRIGATNGNKESLRKYLIALHMNAENTSKIKLGSLLEDESTSSKQVVDTQSISKKFIDKWNTKGYNKISQKLNDMLVGKKIDFKGKISGEQSFSSVTGKVKLVTVVSGTENIPNVSMTMEDGKLYTDVQKLEIIG